MRINKKKLKINKTMVTLAREARGLSLFDLERAIGVPINDLSLIESGQTPPTTDFVEKICQALKFPRDFFKQPIPSIGLDEVFSFQFAFSEMDPFFKAAINVIKIHIDLLLQSVELKQFYFKYDLMGSPKEAARSLREYWNIKKIDNLIQVLEEKEIIVIFLQESSKCSVRLSNCSMISKNGIPIIFKSTPVGDDYNTRMEIAKEIGYLVMYANKDQRSANKEEMNKALMDFAFEFLVPENEIKENLNFADLNIQKLMEFNKVYKVPINLLYFHIVRTFNLLPDIHFFSSAPPEDIERKIEEVPTLLRDIIDLHLNELQYSKNELADFLYLEENELISRYFSFPIELKFLSPPRTIFFGNYSPEAYYHLSRISDIGESEEKIENDKLPRNKDPDVTPKNETVKKGNQI